MKRFSGLFLCFMLCALCFCSCTVQKSNDDVVTGDVVQDLNDVENNENDENNENENMPEDVGVEQNTPDDKALTAEDIIKNLGGNVTLRGGDSSESAQAFCEAVVTADCEKLAAFTGGLAEYYDFLSGINIKYYSLYPFVLGEDARSYAEENGLYIGGTDMYIAEFDVENADGEYFDEGINYYYLEFSFSGYEFDESVSAFVPAKDAKSVMFSPMNVDYAEYFINQTISLMDDGNNIQDGRNNADVFSFNDSAAVHYITHLMARCGRYSEPPYTMNEIEEFVKQSFDGHSGQLTNSVMSFTRWIYPLLDEEKTSFTKDDRAYGCSYAHGGTSSEYTILEEIEEYDVLAYEVQLYADFSNFAKAKKLTFLFEKKEDEVVTLLGIIQSDNTNRAVAGMSF